MKKTTISLTMADGMAKALNDVTQERIRQVDEEGYTPASDDAYDGGQLAYVAAAYALPGPVHGGLRGRLYAVSGWDTRHYKPTDRRRDLTKAAALLLAEIERLDRVINKKA